MSGSTGKEERTWRLRDLADWLTVQLTQGPCTAKDILRSGGAEGWSPGQIKRAKLALRVTCYKEKKSKGRWIWQLPAKPTQPVYHDAEPAPWPESGPEGKRSGVVVVNHIYGSARGSSQDEDPLAWLDRVSNRGRLEVPPLKELKENKEFKGTTENGALERGRSTAPELPGRDSMGG